MIYILLPAYNEEDALRPLMEKIRRVMNESGLKYQVVVVNDGSIDGTTDVLGELVNSHPIKVINNKYNRGLGETIRDGMEYIAEVAKPDDVIVRMDCDDTHDPKYIPTMIKRINKGYEVVIASRYAKGGGQIGVDWYRATISRIANLIIKFFFPIRGVKEYTCGFRAYRVSFIQDTIDIFGNRFIDLKGMGFTGTVEKIIKCKLMGARVTEIPFVLRYDQKKSQSKVVTSITTLGYLVLIAKYIAFWGDIGQIWKKKISLRKKAVYQEQGYFEETN
ncbi:MAG: glycosyltransferase [Aliifodinibius sp.]|nr:glycosyltransferase family 2 protein [Fodinibius sp.]NIV11433.1 glycosyltransferase [Fodinibius sp.]NIY25038.1 glycosyltransferase [Fodinibius sp.]